MLRGILRLSGGHTAYPAIYQTLGKSPDEEGFLFAGETPPDPKVAQYPTPREYLPLRLP